MIIRARRGHGGMHGGYNARLEKQKLIFETYSRDISRDKNLKLWRKNKLLI